MSKLRYLAYAVVGVALGWAGYQSVQRIRQKRARLAAPLEE